MDRWINIDIRIYVYVYVYILIYIGSPGSRHAERARDRLASVDQVRAMHTLQHQTTIPVTRASPGLN